jgi:hypothetical protein
MFKKHSFAIALGLLSAAPAFADATTTEGIIYQADQTGAQANINQVVVEGAAQAAAILQIDSTATGNADTHNIGTVIQGAVGGNATVAVDASGASASNSATALLSGVAGTADYVAPTIVDLSAYADQATGAAPYGYTVQGTTSSNYGLVVQNGQQKSQAVVIQATSAEVDAAIPAQAALNDANLPANADADAASATIGGTFAQSATDSNSGQSVVVKYTGGALTVNYDGTNDVAVGGGLFAEPTNADGNLAVINQGGHIGSITTANGGTIDADDSYAGTGETKNQALALQSGTNSYASIGQQGQLNSALLVQNGDSNFAESYQYEGDLGSPANEFSLIAQVGNFNISQVYQSGTFNSSYVFQNGDGNVAVVDQAVASAGGAVSFIYQSNAANGGAVSTGNYASVYQRSAQ